MEEASGKGFLAPEKHTQEETSFLFPLDIFMPGQEAWNSFTHLAANLRRAEAREPLSLDVVH